MPYRGITIPLPLGSDGLTGSKNLANIPPTYLVEATNITYANGTIGKEPGAAKYNSTVISGAPTVHAGWDHVTNALAQRMVVALSDGTLKKDSGSGAFATTLKSGLANAHAFFCEGGKEVAANSRKLFLFTGVDVVQVLADDAATTSNIATPPADWSGSNQPRFGFLHGSRLMAGGNLNDPHRLYFSTLANHEDFTGAGSGSLAIYPGEGERLVGGISYKGRAILWKYPRGIYLVDSSSTTITDWSVSRLTSTVGGVSPSGYAITENDVLFVDATGAIQSLRAVQEFGDVGGQSLSALALLDPFLRSALNMGALGFTRAIYYASKREVIFALGSTGATTINDRRLVVDLNLPQKPRFRWSDRDICPALWLRKDTLGVPRPLVGDNAGFVWLLDQEPRIKDGAGYLARFATVPTDLGYLNPGLAQKTKNLEFIRVTYEPLGNWNVNLDVVADNKIVSSLSIALGTSGFVLGIAVLGVDTLGGGGIRTARRRISGRGRRVSVVTSASGPGEDFSIASIEIDCVIGDDAL